MKQINIKPDESILYEKYFSICDKDKSGKIPIIEAKRFLLKSGLSVDDIDKISEYAGAFRLGYYGRSQFYVALKIVGLCQAGCVLNPEIIHSEAKHEHPEFKHEVDPIISNSLVEKESDRTVAKSPTKLHQRTFSGSIQLEKLHTNLVNKRYQLRQQAFSASHIQVSSPQGSSSWENNLQPLSNEESSINTYNSVDLPNQSIPIDSDDENNWDNLSDEDNKGLLDPSLRIGLDELIDKHFDANESTSSSEHENVTCQGNDPDDSDESSSEYDNDDNNDKCSDYGQGCNDCDNTDYDAKGYTLMEPVECLATSPRSIASLETIPTATMDQLEYYTKCYQTLQPYDNDKVLGSDAIDFFSLYNLEKGNLNQILELNSIRPEIPINIVQFTRSLHIIIHVKNGYLLTSELPQHLLPIEFEQPDEPFSFDLSTGEQTDLSSTFTNVPESLSQVDSNFSADGDGSAFDFVDVVINRNWKQQKHELSQNAANKKHQYLSKSFNLSGSTSQSQKSSNISYISNDESFVVGRPRPTKKSISLPQSQTMSTNSVAPPPPPRSTIPITNDSSLSRFKHLSLERNTNPSGDASILLSPTHKPVVSPCHIPQQKKTHSISSSSSSSSSITSSSTASSNFNSSVKDSFELDSQQIPQCKSTLSYQANEARKQLLTTIRELKSKNHVLLRLNNEMTSELEELREQRVNLNLQLDYMRQSQLDIS